jgi:Zn-dependent M28 family amino/carboxypeptidase
MTNYRSDKEWRVYHYSLELSLKDIVNELSKKYSFANNISGYRPGGSDHAPFFKKGIPVVFLHTGSHPHYHKTSDTPDKLNYNGLVCVSKLALEILIKIDNSN